MTIHMDLCDTGTTFSCMHLLKMKQRFQGRRKISKITKQLFLRRLIVLLGLFLTSASMSTLWAQVIDTEPNNSCTTAQQIGKITLPFRINGHFNGNDSDYYQLTGTAGSVVKVDLQGQDLDSDPRSLSYIEVLNTNCNWLASSAYFSIGDIGLAFTVPETGVFVLAVVRCCTDDLDDQVASSVDAGSSYQLSITKQKSIGSISGALINARTGLPITMSDDPYAQEYSYAKLDRCIDDQCSMVSSVIVDDNGRFKFDRDRYGTLLEKGRFKITTEVSQYDLVQTIEFEVVEDENFDFGDIVMQPPAIEFSDIQACNISSNGGKCRYSMRIHNNQDIPLKGLAWDFVSADRTGAIHEYSYFQSGKHRIKISANSSQVIRFKFNVPDTVDDGAEFCTQIFVSDDASYFRLRARSNLFCVEKGAEQSIWATVLRGS